MHKFMTALLGASVSGGGGGSGCGFVLATPYDDQFDCGATIDTTGTRFSGANAWTAFNLSDLATAQSGSVLTLTAPTYTNSMEVRGYTQTLPAGNFRFRMPVTQPGLFVQSYACAGLFLRESGTGKILAHVMGYDGGFRPQVRRLTSSTGWYANYNYSAYGNAQKNDTFYLEIERSGSTLLFTTTNNGTDGNDLTTPLSTADQVVVAQTTDFTTAPNQIGILINAEPLLAGNIATSEWFLRLV